MKYQLVAICIVISSFYVSQTEASTFIIWSSIYNYGTPSISTIILDDSQVIPKIGQFFVHGIAN